MKFRGGDWNRARVAERLRWAGMLTGNKNTDLHPKLLKKQSHVPQTHMRQKVNYWMVSKSRAWRSLEVLFVQEKSRGPCPVLLTSSPYLSDRSFALLLFVLSSVSWSCEVALCFPVYIYIYIFLCEVFLWAAVGVLQLWSVVELCSGALGSSVLQRAPAATTVPTLPTLCSLLLSCICASSLSVWLMLNLLSFL